MGVFFIFLLYIYGGYAVAQGITIMSYNCENTFDTIHDTGKNDTDFLPDGAYKWNGYRMYQKLKSISKVIMAARETRPVDIVCLQEVENENVINSLTMHTGLASVGYKYVMTCSDDPRGIDIALLYNPFTIRIINSHSIRPNTSTPTRDILYTCCLAGGRDTIDIYTVHMPSRLNGRTSLINRQAVVDAILESVDSLNATRHDPHIIILGDFNDGPQSKLITKRFPTFINLANMKKKSMPHYIIEGNKDVRGTYKYKGKWDNIDQILINKELFEHSKQQDDKQTTISAIIFAPEFLLEKDKQYKGVKPHRTFVWHTYNGGISDHLPVIVNLSFNNKH